jgi:hypothetical protein
MCDFTIYRTMALPERVPLFDGIYFYTHTAIHPSITRTGWTLLLQQFGMFVCPTSRTVSVQSVMTRTIAPHPDALDGKKE